MRINQISILARQINSVKYQTPASQSWQYTKTLKSFGKGNKNQIKLIANILVCLGADWGAVKNAAWMAGCE